MIIDFHTHIFPPQVIENRQRYVDCDTCFAALYEIQRQKLITAEELIESMDASKVDISVVQNIGWTSHELCVETNDYIIDAVKKYPGRLAGFCSVQPLSMDAAIKENRTLRCRRQFGGWGVETGYPDAAAGRQRIHATVCRCAAKKQDDSANA